MEQLSAREIIDFIGNAKKKTPVKVYIKGSVKDLKFPKSIKAFAEKHTATLFGDWEDVKHFLKKHQSEIDDYEIEADSRNSAVPLLDIKNINARIEPGAIIRDHVTIGNNAVIMMGAIINIGAEIGRWHNDWYGSRDG